MIDSNHTQGHASGHPLLDAVVNTMLLVLVFFSPKLYDYMLASIQAVDMRTFLTEGREVILFLTALLAFAKVSYDFFKSVKNKGK